MIWREMSKDMAGRYKIWRELKKDMAGILFKRYGGNVRRFSPDRRHALLVEGNLGILSDIEAIIIENRERSDP